MPALSSPLIEKLISALQILPGVGPKSAQRIAFYLLERERQRGLHLAQVIQEAINQVGKCERCRTLSETKLCFLCSHSGRDSSLLCVLETPIDVLAIEQTGSYRGYYFVLMGRLSPIDGIGPAELGFDKLIERFKEGLLREVILATNPTVEGEATAHYIAELAKKYQIKTSRIAYGVPLGGELEYIDGGTLVRALEGRNIF